MLQFQSHHHRLLPSNLPSSTLPILRFRRLDFLCPNRQPLPDRAATSVLYRTPRATAPWLAEAAEPPVSAGGLPLEDGPVELPPTSSSIFATSDDPTPLQVATSILLTGAIGVFLFRSIRRRAKRAKELRLRSSGGKKTPQEEALARLNAINLGSVKAKEPPSPVQALLGGITAGVIAVILFKFTTTIEAALNRQNVSDNFSVDS